MGISRNFVVKLPVRCQSFSAHLQDDTYLPRLQGSHQKAPILGFEEHFLMENPSLLQLHRVLVVLGDHRSSRFRCLWC